MYSNKYFFIGYTWILEKMFHVNKCWWFFLPVSAAIIIFTLQVVSFFIFWKEFIILNLSHKRDSYYLQEHISQLIEMAALSGIYIIDLLTTEFL